MDGIGHALPPGQRLFIQPVVNRLQQSGNPVLQLVQGYEGLLPVIPPHQDALVVFHILGADFQPQGHALHLIFRELPAGGVV